MQMVVRRYLFCLRTNICETYRLEPLTRCEAKATVLFAMLDFLFSELINKYENQILI